MTDSKNINNPVGQGGGQRKKLSRAERQNNGPHRNLDARMRPTGRRSWCTRCARRQAYLRVPCRRATTRHRTDAPLSRCR